MTNDNLPKDDKWSNFCIFVILEVLSRAVDSKMQGISVSLFIKTAYPLLVLPGYTGLGARALDPGLRALAWGA